MKYCEIERFPTYSIMRIFYCAIPCMGFKGHKFKEFVYICMGVCGSRRINNSGTGYEDGQYPFVLYNHEDL